MKKISLLLISFLLAYFAIGQTNGTVPNIEDYHKGQLFVKVKDDAHIDITHDDIHKYDGIEHINIINEYGITSIRKYFNLENMNRIYKVKLDTTANLDTVISRFQNLSYIDYAEKCPVYRLSFVPNDNLYAETPNYTEHQWALHTIDAEGAWLISQGIEDVILAVTDDAVFLDHPDLQANIWVNQDEIPTSVANTIGNGDGIVTSSELATAYGSLANVLDLANNICDGVDSDNNGYTDDIFGWDFANNDNNPLPPFYYNDIFTHGSHVAGIAAGVTNNNQEGISSVSNNRAKIMCVKTKEDNSGILIEQELAVYYCINNNADIINMSWGGFLYSQVLNSLMNTAQANDIVLVAGAGNNGLDSTANTPFYPAAYPATISVGSSTHSPMNAKSDFSSYHSTVDLLAPGTEIQSCVNGAMVYKYESGTSMSTPLTASVAALMKSTCPSCNEQQIKACIINSTVDSILNITENLPYTGQIGTGRLSAQKAMVCITQVNPISDFEFEYDYVCPNLNLQVLDQSQGYQIDTWEWILPSGAHFGGSVATEQNPHIYFDYAGTFSITLNVEDAYGNTSSVTKDIQVSQIDVDFLIDNPTGCLGEQSTLAMSILGNSPFTVDYNVSGSATITETNAETPYLINVNNPSFGTNLSVNILQITDASGCTLEASQSIFVNLQECDCESKINNNWIFGMQAGYNFSSQSPFVVPVEIDSVFEGGATISKPNGDLLFTTNGIKVWDAEGNQIMYQNNPDSLLYGHISAARSGLIVPRPGNINQYYIFTTGVTGQSQGSYPSNIAFSIVEFDDIYAPSPTGQIITLNQNMGLPVPTAEGLALIKGDKKYWVVAKGTQNNNDTELTYGNTYFSIEVPAYPELPTTPNAQSIGTLLHKRGYRDMTSSRDGQYIGAIYYDANGNEETILQISTFDNGTGQIIHEKDIFLSDTYGVYDLVFSPNNEYVFCSSPSFGYFWVNRITETVQEVIAGPNFGPHGMEMGPDGIIYMSQNANVDLNAILNPDAANPVFSYDFTSLLRRCWLSLPHYIPPLDLSVDVTSENSSCFNSNSGSVIAQAFGGNPPYEFFWSNGASGDTLNNLAAGDYNLTVIDAYGCTADGSFTIEENPVINIEFDKQMCISGQGTINSTVTGGTGPYSYEWNTGDITSSTENLTGGTYFVTITDANGCQEVASCILESISSPLSAPIEDIHRCEPCINDNGGDIYNCIPITANVTGGASPYTFLWSNNSNSSNPSANTTYYASNEGTHYVTVTDANNCQIIEEFNITLSDLSATATATDGTNGCGGSASIEGTGGLLSYSYHWEGPNGFSSDEQEINYLLAGTYSYTLTDAQGCTVEGEVSIESAGNQPVPQTVYLCQGGSVQLCATTANTYTWDNAATTNCITVNQTGTYTCEVYDAIAECSWTEIFNVEEYDDAVLYASPKCEEGPGNWTWILSVQGGMCNEAGTSYAWSNGSTANPIQVQELGTYTVTVSNGSCNQVLSYEVQPVQMLSSTFSTIEPGTSEIISGGVWAVQGPISVEEGAELTLKYAELYMTKDICYIKIEPKGYVLNEGSKLSACETWQGVTVNGKSTAYQHPITDQGYYKSYAGAEIEHAKRAIYSYRGGMFDVQYSKFSNNLVSVYCAAYPSGELNSISYNKFYDNKIRVNDNKRYSDLDYYPVNPNYRKYQVHFQDIQKHKDIHVDIINESTDGTKVCGVFSKGVKVSVIKSTQSRSRFKNLEIGFEQFDSGNEASSVKNTDFINTKKGIATHGADFFEVSNCTFDMAGINDPESYGVYINTGEEPNITLNTFNNGARGLLLNQTSGEYTVYKNTFKHFSYNPAGGEYMASAIVASGDNTTVGTNSLEGVQFKCNNFNTNNKSLSVIDALDNTEGKVRKNQGIWLGSQSDIKDPANNIYYNECSVGDDAFFVQSSAVLSYNYYFHHTLAEMDFEECHSINVTKIPAIGPTSVTYADACPNDPNSGGGNGLPCPPYCEGPGDDVIGLDFGSMYNTLLLNDIQIVEKEEALSEKVDKGNTSLLASEVNTASTDDYTEVAQKVSENDGFISDRVIDEFMVKDVGRPVAKTIALAQNSPLPEQAKEKITQAGLPEDMQNYLEAQQNGVSKREQKEQEIAHLKQQRQRVYSFLLKAVLADSSLSKADSLLDLMDLQTDISIRKQTVKLLEAMGRRADALQRIAEIRQDIANTEQAEAHDDLLQTEAIGIESRGLDTEQKQVFLQANKLLLLDIYNKQDKAAVKAYMLLKDMGEELENPIRIETAFPRKESNREASFTSDNQFNKPLNMDGWLSLYPNPVKGRLTVEYLLSANADTKMKIYDINGKLLMQEDWQTTMGIKTVDVSSYSEGVYILTIGKQSKEFVVK